METDDVLATESGDSGPVDHPEVIGSYRILRVLGEGGMGTVYEAEQLGPVCRRVALKVVRLGMDTPQVVARFETERQALAVMDHPHIAKVHDAGSTTTGRPYFVMELVRGVSITDYCDTHKLATRERLELFVPVCEAVHHAHQKGVVHRDLKPSNVLVTLTDDRAFPKVIDFGVAKAVAHRFSAHTLVTQFGQPVGTPEYMSPEQAEMSGLDVDTRSDIYSLGVMLYELLSGTLPFEMAPIPMAGLVQQLLRETDPPTPSRRYDSLGDRRGPIAARRNTDPSTLRRLLRGDLDWIIMKAMDKDRTRRYESAAALGQDIRRHLNHEAIDACPPSATYRAAKFVRRHWAGVGAAAVAVVALAVGAAGATAGFIRARAAESAAREDAETARRVTDFVVDLFDVVDPSESRGNTITAREILDRGARQIQSGLDDQPVVQATMMDVMGRVYSHLGLYSDARPLLEGAAGLRRNLVGRDAELGQSLRELAELHRIRGQLDSALAIALEAVEVLTRAGGQDDSLSAQAIEEAGIVYRDLGEYDQASEYLERSLEIRERVFGPDHLETAWAHYQLAWLYRRRGDPERARRAYERAMPIAERELGGDDWKLANIVADLGVTFSDLHQYDSARTYYLRALSIRERTLGPDHLLVGAVVNNLGVLEWRNGNYPEAQRYYERSLEIKERALGPDSRDVALALTNLALLNQNMGAYAEAMRLYQRSLAVREKVLGPNHVDVANTLTNYGYLLRYIGMFQEARRVLERALSIEETVNGPNHPELVFPLRNLGLMFGDMGEYDLARQQFERLLAIGEGNPVVGEGTVAGTLADLADVQIHLRQYSIARENVERALSIQPEMDGAVIILAIAHRGSGDTTTADSLLLHWLTLVEADVGRESDQYAFSEARYWCVVGDYGRAIGSLKVAMERGFADPWLFRNHELAVLRGNPEFEAMVREVKRRAGIDRL